MAATREYLGYAVVAATLAWLFLTFVFVPVKIEAPRWRTALSLLGVRDALRSAWRMAAVRYGQPFRDLRSTAPGPVSAVALAASIWCYANWSGSFLDPIWIPTIAAAIVAFVWIWTCVTPPLIVFLGISDYDQFRLSKVLKDGGRLSALSLINQRSVGVAAN
jgi:hypothetical protein